MRFKNMVTKYSKLDDSGKSTFLQIITNTLLVVFTFWLGLSLQFFISDSNKRSSELLSKAQYITYILPIREQINLLDHENKSISYDIISDGQMRNNNRGDITYAFPLVGSRFLTLSDIDKNKFVSRTDSILVLCNKVKYYLPSANFQEYQKNLSLCYLSNWIFREIFVNGITDKKLLLKSYDALVSSGQSFLTLNNHSYRNGILTINIESMYKLFQNMEQTSSCGAFLLQTDTLLNELTNAIDSSLEYSKKTFFTNNPLVNSLFLLLIFTIIAIIFTRIIMVKALSEHSSVSRTEYNTSKKTINELSTENYHLKREIEQFQQILKNKEGILENKEFIIEQKDKSYDNLYDMYLDTLEEIKKLKYGEDSE